MWMVFQSFVFWTLLEHGPTLAHYPRGISMHTVINRRGRRKASLARAALTHANALAIVCNLLENFLNDFVKHTFHLFK